MFFLSNFISYLILLHVTSYDSLNWSKFDMKISPSKTCETTGRSSNGFSWNDFHGKMISHFIRLYKIGSFDIELNWMCILRNKINETLEWHGIEWYALEQNMVHGNMERHGNNWVDHWMNDHWQVGVNIITGLKLNVSQMGWKTSKHMQKHTHRHRHRCDGREDGMEFDELKEGQTKA